MTTLHILGYGYSEKALHNLADYGVSAVRSGKKSSIRFGILEQQEGSLRTYLSRTAPEVTYTVTHGKASNLAVGQRAERVCPCCGRKR